MKRYFALFLCVMLMLIFTGCSTIELDVETLDLKLGETSQITPDTKDTPVTYQSSDTSVATVDENGTITTVGIGTATVTATNSKGKAAECVVTVTHVEPSGISLKETAYSLEPENTVELDITFEPANTTNFAVSYASSNEAIATVDQNGKITGISSGTTTITVTTENGKTATCEVKVLPYPESIALSKQTIDIMPGESSMLSVTYAPEDCVKESIAWTSSDESIATVSQDGTITGISAGTATITATATHGATATCEITVPPYADSISINKSLTLVVKGTENLSVTFNPDNCAKENLIWSSSNTSVATVANGKVTAVSAGTATITVETEITHLKASCTVQVTPPPLTITGISMSRSASIVGTSYQITYNITASATGGSGGYSYKFEILQNGNVTKSTGWTSNNGISGSISGNGTCTLRVTVKDSSGKTASETYDMLR